MTYIHQGYVALTGKQYRTHPLYKNNILLEHRMVLYDSIGPGKHKCHWCGIIVAWNVNLNVDHLNFVKNDNRIENLVPSCPGCNRSRSELTRSELMSTISAGTRLVLSNREKIFSCCSTDFVGIGRYRAHRRWNHKSV